MKERIGIGMIGTGFGSSTQIPAFRAIPGGSITAVASGHRANAERVAAQHGIGFYTGDWREVVARDDVDLVSIAAPPGLHCEIALAAFDAGKHVLCEKPMALDAREAATMRDAARGNGLLALIDHELRFLNARRQMQRMIREGAIGSVQHVALHERRDSRSDPDRPWTWWSDEAQGGGELGALGSHAIDTIHWLLDARSREVVALLSTYIPERPDRTTGDMKSVTADDAVRLLIGLEGPRVADGTTALVSLSSVESGPPEHRVEVFGSDGALQADQNGDLRYSPRGSGIWKPVTIPRQVPAPDMADTEWTRGFTHFSRLIVEALQRGESHVEGAATFDDGHAVQLVIDAAHRSAESRKWEPVGYDRREG